MMDRAARSRRTWRTRASEWARRNAILAIATIWLLSTFITGPVNPAAASEKWHWRLGPIYLGRPIVTSGDSPHYLVVLNSLIEDFDLDLANNYAQVAEGDWDAGTRVRWTEFGGHSDIDKKGRMLSFHPFYRPLMLALTLWPWRGSEWVESLAIWFTMLGTLAGLALLNRTHLRQTHWLLLLALATPLWCYSRDLWGEAWLAAAWIALLTCQSPWTLAAVSFLACLVKYPFAVVPLTLAALALWRLERKRALILGGSAMAALLLAICVNQWVFADAGHFSLFHQGARHLPGEVPFELSLTRPIRGTIGLLFDPRSGLLAFAPFLLWGLPQLRKGGDWYLPFASFFLLHASYAGWHGGAGYSARFLVPAIPLLVTAVAARKPEGLLFRIAVVYSLFWGFVAGMMPIAVFDKTPVEALQLLIAETAAIWSG